MGEHGELPDLLRRLHAELERATHLDAESRELLGVLARDLQRFEAHRASASEYAVRFEAEHPDVAATLRQIADLFGKAGI
ncbi:MAG: DUF4404 family protein [Steroidobacteraceae bacterium]|jgi:hypothetical protein|nr:DUF4404 family protein [Steroidobacteraceae bacterium]